MQGVYLVGVTSCCWIVNKHSFLTIYILYPTNSGAPETLVTSDSRVHVHTSNIVEYNTSKIRAPTSNIDFGSVVRNSVACVDVYTRIQFDQRLWSTLITKVPYLDC